MSIRNNSTETMNDCRTEFHFSVHLEAYSCNNITFQVDTFKLQVPNVVLIKTIKDYVRHWISVYCKVLPIQNFLF